MGFDFIKKLPTPEEIRNQYPIDAEIQAIKDARDQETSRRFYRQIRQISCNHRSLFSRQ